MQLIDQEQHNFNKVIIGLTQCVKCEIHKCNERKHRILPQSPISSSRSSKSQSYVRFLLKEELVSRSTSRRGSFFFIC